MPVHDGLVSLVERVPHTCWQCGGDVPAFRYPGKLCSDSCTRSYWGIEGDATQSLPVYDDQDTHG